MGYRIVYGTEPVHFGWRTGGQRRRIGMVAGCLLIFLVITMQFWPEGRATLERMVLPGDPAVTKQAFSVMTEQLQAGDAIADAVAAFCQEVIDGAETTP